jgi:hypothetical protein
MRTSLSFQKTSTVLLILGSLVAPSLHAQWDPSDTLLAGITNRGRFLASYDQAASHATEAVMSYNPDPESAGLMVAFERPDRHWDVLFGRLTERSDTFYVAYRAEETAWADSVYVRVRTSPQALTGFERYAATAVSTALGAFGTFSSPYNVYVLPRRDGMFFVYLLPAQTNYGVFPHGADVRYLVSADGHRIVDQHRMHKALLNLALPDSAIAGMHSVVTDDYPQDSDVFLVLARTPGRPELISTEHHNYEIHLDGSISWRRGERRDLVTGN